MRYTVNYIGFGEEGVQVEAESAEVAAGIVANGGSDMPPGDDGDLIYVDSDEDDREVFAVESVTLREVHKVEP